MSNHITPDGLLAVDQCERTMRYRDEQIIVQDACIPEPRIDLIIQEIPNDPAGQGFAFLQLDVARATALYTALGAFINDSRGQTGWQYGGVVYDLDKAWEGRPGTDYAGMWFRHTGTFHKGLPWMRAEPTPGNIFSAALPVVLGLKPCPVHQIWSSPCYACDLGDVGELSALMDHS